MMQVGNIPCTFEKWQFRTPPIPWAIQQTPLHENPNTHIRQAIKHSLSIMDFFETDVARLGNLFLKTGRLHDDVSEYIYSNRQLMMAQCLQILRQGYGRNFSTNGGIRATHIGPEDSLILEGSFEVDRESCKIVLGAFLVMGQHIFEISRFVIDHENRKQDNIRLARINSSEPLAISSIGLGLQTHSDKFEVCEIEFDIVSKGEKMMNHGVARTHNDPCLGSEVCDENNTRRWPPIYSLIGRNFIQLREQRRVRQGKNSEPMAGPINAVSF